jgi:hypothetical protein
MVKAEKEEKVRNGLKPLTVNGLDLNPVFAPILL